MTQKRRVLLMVAILGWVFIVLGLVFTAESCVRAVNEEGDFDIGAIFAVLVGWGLLKLDRTWRKFALIYIWIGLAVSFILLILMPFGIDPDIQLFSRIVKDAPMGLDAAYLILAILGYGVAFFILTSKTARSAFRLANSEEKREM
jgi:hypothetical protein